VRRQNGLVILAGTRFAWDRLPRDVGPRLIGRDPLRIGNLELAETGLLLDAYHPGRPRFGAATIEAIHRLSGGNPREILQIAHRCWNDAGGRLDSVDEAAVLGAARDGGTLADRAELAMADIDRVIERMGLSGREFRLPNDTLIERLATASGGTQAVAVVLAPATDSVQEVAVAQTMTRIRTALETLPGKPSLLVVPIGYRSDSVRRLIKDISWVEPFDGTDFEARLQGALFQMIVVPPPAGDSSPLLDSVLQRLEKLQSSLEELRTIRQDRTEATATRLAEGTEKLAASEREHRMVQTKWELVDGLERVRAALDSGNPKEERALIQSLLVANEVNVRGSAFDYLGGLYLDALDLEASLNRSFKIRGPTREVQALTVEIHDLRAEIIVLARRSVMQRRGPVPMLPLAFAAVAAVAGSVVAFLASDVLLPTAALAPGILAAFAASFAVLSGLAGWYVDILKRSPPTAYSGVVDDFRRLRIEVTRSGAIVEPEMASPPARSSYWPARSDEIKMPNVVGEYSRPVTIALEPPNPAPQPIPTRVPNLPVPENPEDV
jgi:hypothetical protein